MNAAAESFAANGIGGTFIRDIANSSNATLANVNRHFRTEDTLLGAVVEPKLAVMIRRLSAIARSRKSATRKLGLLYMEYVHCVLRCEPSLSAVFSDAIHGGEHLTYDIKTHLLSLRAMTASIIHEGIEQSAFREVNVEHAVHMVFGTIVPFLGIHQHMRGRRQMARFTRREAAAIADSGVALIMNGLLASDRQRHRT